MFNYAFNWVYINSYFKPTAVEELYTMTSVNLPQLECEYLENLFYFSLSTHESQKLAICATL